jgi:hypothetical protein
MLFIQFIVIMTIIYAIGSLALLYYIKHTPTEEDNE